MGTGGSHALRLFVDSHLIEKLQRKTSKSNGRRRNEGIFSSNLKKQFVHIDWARSILLPSRVSSTTTTTTTTNRRKFERERDEKKEETVTVRGSAGDGFDGVCASRDVGETDPSVNWLLDEWNRCSRRHRRRLRRRRRHRAERSIRWRWSFLVDLRTDFVAKSIEMEMNEENRISPLMLPRQKHRDTPDIEPPRRTNRRSSFICSGTKFLFGYDQMRNVFVTFVTIIIRHSCRHSIVNRQSSR